MQSQAIHFVLSQFHRRKLLLHSIGLRGNMRNDQRGSGLRFDPTGFVYATWVFEDCLDKLAKELLHVARPSREQALQEGDVSTVGRQQQGYVGQTLHDCHREGFEGRQKQNKTD